MNASGVVLAPAGRAGEGDLLLRDVWMTAVRVVELPGLERDADLRADESSMTGIIPLSRAVVPMMLRTSLHSGASQMPSWSVSYLDCFISSIAASTITRDVGRTGRVVSSSSGGARFGTSVRSPSSPMSGPPHDLISAVLVHDEVHRLAHVDVVERRLGQVHREVEGASRPG